MAALNDATLDVLATIDDLVLPAANAPTIGALPLNATQNLEFWAGW